MGSWASLIFFCLFSDFVSFLLHVFSASGLVLFLHTFPAMFVISFYLTFFSFTQFLLLTIPCFFLSYFFILVFIPMLLYKRILPSKGYQTQFALFCQNHSTEDLYSATDLYFVAYHFLMHFSFSPGISLRFGFFFVFFLPFLLFGLLGGPLGFALYWDFFLMSLWVQICKNEHQHQHGKWPSDKGFGPTRLSS